MEGRGSQVSLIFPDINETVLIKARVWGIAGNHEEISISIHENSAPLDSNVKRTFYTSEVFYRKKGRDTLQIFAPSSSYNEKVLPWVGHIILEINPLTGYDQVLEYSLHYKQLGLSRISVYD